MNKIEPAKRHNLPRQLTSFIGRDEAIDNLVTMLTDPGCALLTLVGPGGIGKTRLSIEAATQVLSHFADGVYFVSLQTAQNEDFLPSAIIDVLNLPFHGADDQRAQLIDYLNDKAMLLVLDSFESVLAMPHGQDHPVITFLSDLLAAAPRTKLLITSREVLNLQEEWLYTLDGLATPSQIDPEMTAADVESYPAVQLFVERAQRRRRDFSLAAEAAEVGRICRLVGGSPLAIELAASWTKTMTCRLIGDELQQNLDFLATTLRNVPERHRNLRAVFDHSWQRLTPTEQGVFQRLSVFRGGFRRKAATTVAGASLAVLSSLVDKSLLRWDPGGRYQIHELLRQYAAEQLVRSPEDVAQVYDRHSHYYADFLQDRAHDMTGQRQLQTTQEIAAELENIRAAWWHAVAQADVATLQKAAYTFYEFCDFQGRFQENMVAQSQAIDTLESLEPNEQQMLTLATLFSLQGYNFIRVGRLDEAQHVFEQSQKQYDRAGTPPPPGFGTDPVSGLGLLALVQGDYDRAIQVSQTARQRTEATGDDRNRQINLYVLANATFAQGDYDAAQQYGQQAYALTEREKNRWMMAYVLILLGNIARALGDYEQARNYYQAGYDIKQEFNDPEGLAAALNHLAKVAWLQQDHAQATRQYQQSRAIYEQIRDRGGLATSLQGLGDTAQVQGDYEVARRQLQQALQIATDMAWAPLTLSILASVSELLCRVGQTARGGELAAVAFHHPAGDQETKERARQILAHCHIEPSPDLTAAEQQEQDADLAMLIPIVQAELAAALDTETTTSVIGTTAPAVAASATDALIEPLTDREFEVLHLIAEGLTNRQIADELVISLGTAKWYTAQIYGKLGVSSRTQAVARARELALLE